MGMDFLTNIFKFKEKENEELKQAILVRTDLKMGKGKIASQAAHASIMAFIKAREDKEWNEWAREWLKQGMKKIVLRVEGEKELVEKINSAKDIGLPTSLIRDAGYTQVPSGSLTAGAIGPAPTSRIDKITKALRLL
jgi:PTH2 family peptidyl-tRNA hydrolase